VTEELKKSKAKVIYIGNLMSKIGQTRNRTQKEIVEILEKYTKRKIDFVLLNNGKIPQDAYQRYIDDGEHILVDDLHDGDGRKILRKDLVASAPIKRQKGDELKRSLVRHDSKKLANELCNIFYSDKNDILRFFRSLFGYYKD